MALDQVDDRLAAADEGGADPVVADRRRNGGGQPIGGGGERLGDPRRHDRKAGFLRLRDAGETCHDAPDRSEQPNERRDRGDDGKVGKTALGLRHERATGTHHCLDHPLARFARRLACDRRNIAGRLQDLREHSPLPTVRSTLDAKRDVEPAQHDQRLDDDDPAPDRCRDKNDHHALHDEPGLNEQAPRRQRHDIHGFVSRWSR